MPLIDVTSPVTPSEIIYYHGDKFAPEGGLSRTEIILADKKVNTGKLAESMLAAAILANEATGAIQLQPQEKRGFLGLGSSTVLGIQLVQPLTWAEASLEADLYSIVYQGYGKQPFSVYDYVYHLWTQDKTNPWEEVISIVRWGLVRRNLLIADEKRSLKIFVSYSYQISEDQRSWVSQIPIQPVQQLISNASIQPDKWKMLTREISKALHARQEKSESDFD